MSVTTRFTERVECARPVQLAGLGGGIGTPSLAIAVARAGGLGLLGHPASAAALDAMLDGLPPAGAGRVGVNFLVPFLEPAVVDVAARRARYIDFFWGFPASELVDRAHARGAAVGWQVGSVDEARAAASAGCDVVIVQGVEAGGHVRGTTPIRALLPAVLSAVDLPVVAAGGIATSETVAELMSMGASGVRVGTRFVAAVESGAHDAYVDALLAAGSGDTELTTAFGSDWPDAPHRVLASAVRAAERAGAGARWSAQPPTKATSGDVAAMALYAGTGVGAVIAREPAEAIVADLVRDLR